MSFAKDSYTEELMLDDEQTPIDRFSQTLMNCSKIQNDEESIDFKQSIDLASQSLITNEENILDTHIDGFNNEKSPKKNKLLKNKSDPSSPSKKNLMEEFNNQDPDNEPELKQLIL